MSVARTRHFLNISRMALLLLEVSGAGSTVVGTYMTLNDAAMPVKMPVKRILVIEDDPAMQRMLGDYLRRNDMDVAVASHGRDVPRLLDKGSFSLILLDLRLGQEDGLDLLRAMRTHSDVPVIVITGHKVEEIDRVVGLEMGADDYLTKPFSLRELLARIRVVLRRMEAVRVEAARPPARDAGPTVSRFGHWKLDRTNRRLSKEGGTGGDVAGTALTKGEYALLVAFLDAPMRPLSREHLINATRLHEDVYDRSIDVQILRLRRKLRADGNTPEVIRTERGLGYVFALAVAHERA